MKGQSLSPICIVYIHNPSRAHKLLPLLDSFPLIILKQWGQLFRLTFESGGAEYIIIADAFKDLGIFGVIASILLRAPFVYRLRGESFREERERLKSAKGLMKWPRFFRNLAVQRLCLRRARMVICNSEYLSKAMRKWIKGRPCVIVHNPYTPPSKSGSVKSPLLLPRAEFHLLSITNMNLYPKVQPIWEAVSEWMPGDLWETLDISWVICGDGTLKGHFERVVQERRLSNRVAFAGKIDDVGKAYDWCDVLIHLTRMDGFPNVPMEAMMHGKPVITNFDSCGTREQVFHNVNGFVVKNSDEFINALLAYRNDKELRRTHGVRGKELVASRFSVDLQRERMREALLSLWRWGVS